MNPGDARSLYRDFVERVREANDIVDVISQDVDLTSAGSTLKGLSPLRNESHPSFTVWPGTQSWCDFSGGGRTGGDVFAYIQAKNGVGFKEALNILAKRVGIQPPNQNDTMFNAEIALLDERREVESLLTEAARLYHRRLPSKIREKLLRTHYGFSDQTIDDLCLGWADGHLFDAFIQQGIPKELALKTGLFILTREGVKDFFRNRIVFPYWKKGQVVYFIARATEFTGDEQWEQAKYKKLLTHAEKRPYISETVQNEYFYNEDAAHGADDLLITEGVTDCLSAMQAGIACISPVTTRFRAKDTEKLVRLTRTAKRIVICNDNEKNSAGTNGAIDTATALFEAGRDVNIATIPLPEGKDKIDINELVVHQGEQALRDILSDATLILDYMIEQVTPDTKTADLIRKLEPIFTLLLKTDPISKTEYLDQISKRFKVTKGALNDCLDRIKKKKRARRTGWDGSLPMIVTNNRQLIAIVEEAAEILIASNRRHMTEVAAGLDSKTDIPLMFSRAGSFVQLIHPRNKPVFISDVNPQTAYAVLTRVANWVYANGDDEYSPVFPPKDVARDLVTLVPSQLPELDTVITTPVFGSVGNLIDRPGYNETDCVWLHPVSNFCLPNVPEIPTDAEVEEAKALFLDDLFVDFPFVTPGDRAGIFAALLLPFLRRMIAGPTPIHLVEAPTPGSGKSLLCDIVSIVATGSVCDAQTLPQNEDEIRKQITAELSKARPIILLDNAKERRRVESSALASVATTENWTDRILGESRMITLSNTALWFLTGNNPVLSSELTRRTIRIRLDSKQDMPWRRSNFKHKNIVGWAKKNRSRLVKAALTLIQAWIVESKPEGEKCLGSFENWSAVMDGLFQVIGVDGFLENLDDFYAQADTEGEMWRDFTGMWWANFSDDIKTASELNAFCETHELLQSVRGDRNEHSQKIRLGMALIGARDRVYNHLQICTTKNTHKKKNQFFLKKLNEDETVTPMANRPSDIGIARHEDGEHSHASFEY